MALLIKNTSNWWQTHKGGLDVYLYLCGGVSLCDMSVIYPDTYIIHMLFVLHRCFVVGMPKIQQIDINSSYFHVKVPPNTHKHHTTHIYAFNPIDKKLKLMFDKVLNIAKDVMRRLTTNATRSLFHDCFNVKFIFNTFFLFYSNRTKERTNEREKKRRMTVVVHTHSCYSIH